MEIYYILGILAILLGYNMTYTNYTLAIGKVLSNTDTATGLQDAITPKWQTVFAGIIYLLSITAIIINLILSGWVYGVLTIPAFYIASCIPYSFLKIFCRGHFYRSILKNLYKRKYKMEELDMTDDPEYIALCEVFKLWRANL